MTTRPSPPPTDPVDRIHWIRQAHERLDADLERCLFDARLQGRFDEARTAAGLARKPALRMTRRVNESLGRQVRWNDGN